MLKYKKLFLIITVVILIALLYFLLIKSSVVGSIQVKNEINNLLIPLDAKTLNEADFDKLKALVKNDDYASEEVNELVVLAKYKEYSHIGHGLGFIYDYVQTGNQSICPGHLLSHYYIFSKHNEMELANDNLEEAKEQIQDWIKIEEAKNQTYLYNVNYTKYKQAITSSLVRINNSDSTASEDEISLLAEAPCAQ